MSSTIQHKKHLQELEQLIRGSCLAIEELDKTIKEFPKIMESPGEDVFEDLKRNNDLAWHHINGLLIYTARISRILWQDEKYSFKINSTDQDYSIIKDSLENENICEELKEKLEKNKISLELDGEKGYKVKKGKFDELKIFDIYAKMRGEKLRNILNISDNSIFHYQNRDVRNDFDHIDERIDDYECGDLKSWVDRNIAPINDWIGNMGAGDYARHYDPETRIIYFGLHSLSIDDLIEELKHLEREVANQLS